MFKKLFGLSKDDSTSKGMYTRLADNLIDIVDDIAPLIDSIEEGYRAYLLEDFTKVMLLANKGSILDTYHKFAFAALCHLIVQRDASVLDSLKRIPEHHVVMVLVKLYDNQQKFFSKLDSYNYKFTLNSFPLFEGSDLDRLKKALYEFAEVVVKADGTVSADEAQNLKNLHAKYLTKGSVPENTVEESTVQKLHEQSDTNDNDTETIKPDVPLKTVEQALAELNELVGLDNIKEDIKSLINILKSNKLRKEEGLPEMKISLHSVFSGPPGTGKTTIARILSTIYGGLGVLPQNNFVETDRSGLVAGFVGQTAIKTDKLIKEALNGVLFIDEAYTLSRGDNNDYGQEAIDTILKRMEDDRDKLVVIVAGYNDEMTDFINSNPGLQSRFSRYFYFKDYDQVQLTQIFKNMANKAGFTLTDSATQKITELFTHLYTNRNDRFGNARLVRNIFEKTFERHANRTAGIAPITRAILTTIEDEDIPFQEFWQGQPI